MPSHHCRIRPLRCCITLMGRRGCKTAHSAICHWRLARDDPERLQGALPLPPRSHPQAWWERTPPTHIHTHSRVPRHVNLCRVVASLRLIPNIIAGCGRGGGGVGAGCEEVGPRHKHRPDAVYLIIKKWQWRFQTESHSDTPTCNASSSSCCTHFIKGSSSRDPLGHGTSPRSIAARDLGLDLGLDPRELRLCDWSVGP